MPITQPNILFQRPFAANGNRAAIPDSPTGTGKASLVEGFPPVTSMPLQAGGIPPDRLDFNGILYMLSRYAHWIQSGGLFSWSETLDYSPPCMIERNGNYYFCLQANGVTTPAGIKVPGNEPAYWQQLNVTGGGGGPDPNEPGIPDGSTINGIPDVGSINEIPLPASLRGVNGIDVSEDDSSGNLDITVKYHNADISQVGAVRGYATEQEIVDGTAGDKILAPDVMRQYTLDWMAGTLPPPTDFGDGDFEMSEALITQSGTWTAPKTGKYLIIPVGGGGGGGGTASGVAGGGGGGGGSKMYIQDLVKGDMLSITIGAGGTVAADGNVKATGGGETSVTLPDSTRLTGGGGGGGGSNGAAGGGGGGSSGDGLAATGSGRGGNGGGSDGGLGGVATTRSYGGFGVGSTGGVGENNTDNPDGPLGGRSVIVSEDNPLAGSGGGWKQPGQPGAVYILW